MLTARTRLTSLLGAMAITAAAVAAVQLTGATAASAVAGQQVVKAISSINSTASKSATAYCPAGKQVLGGGGGLVWDLQHHSRAVALTRMEPVHPGGGALDYFIVTGAETSAGETGDWWLDAYAICADPMAGYTIVSASTATSSTSAQLAQATCPGVKKVIGTGASVSTTSGQVALQVMRASLTTTSSYAQGHEDADGYLGLWYATAFAVCVNAPAGYEIVQDPSAYSDSEAEKVAASQCPVGKKVHGAGGAIAFTAPGHVALTRILVDPYLDGREVDAVAAELTSTGTDWDFIVSQVICAN
ncbi:hypothetical protein F4553_000942 [Allocatelliglobosispora scoriae]|uniref:Uncharacterized protein n=1 Tax=Allocatelliglobosispora scoriae TaxID=643052 RepID=A0A841BKN6_9ACTN|nr:hypothetical protein [Allocatelliglobosispora scoriae]MBB5867563.1 hypothetical protein [Allocatelliglobosispora scoriae]